METLLSRKIVYFFFGRSFFGASFFVSSVFTSSVDAVVTTASLRTSAAGGSSPVVTTLTSSGAFSTSAPGAAAFGSLPRSVPSEPSVFGSSVVSSRVISLLPSSSISVVTSTAAPGCAPDMPLA